MKKKLKNLILKFFIKLIIITFLGIEILMYYINLNKLFEKWKKYKLNPVLGDHKKGSVFEPFVIQDENNLYRMYYSWRIPGKIALSLSLDGFNWSDFQIVLNKGNSKSWDSIVNGATVIFKDRIYYMWYIGQNKGVSKIGYATSKNGLNFIKKHNPVLIPEYNYEKKSVMNPHVIHDIKEKIYKMWYAAGDTLEPYAISYAISKDGVKWKKYKYNPIFIPNKNKSSFDSFKVGGCDVHKISDNKYLIFYIGYSDTNTARIFAAESKNGITTVKYEAIWIFLN